MCVISSVAINSIANMYWTVDTANEASRLSPQTLYRQKHIRPSCLPWNTKKEASFPHLLLPMNTPVSAQEGLITENCRLVSLYLSSRKV